jgi:multiple sugar transport system ATP-binding protein
MWSGEVVHAEDLGSDNYLFVEVGADEPLIVRREGKLTAKVGDKVQLSPKSGALYRFDEAGKPIR